ncbi:VOC family protein [bacterium]|nr:VOC family protein [bacterium]
MLKDCSFHHIGNAVQSIEAVTPLYIETGYKVSDSIIENTQRVRVAYATKEGFPRMELLEPLDEKSHLNNVLKRNGCGPYHICYAVKDIDKAVAELKTLKYVPLGKPVPGHGLDDALTVFLYNKHIGLVQLAQMVG